MKKYEYCANCGKKLGDTFVMILDNFLQVKYFEEQDGSDNAFCDKECACEALMIEEVENWEDEAESEK